MKRQTNLKCRPKITQINAEPKGKLLRAKTRKISQAKGHNSKNGAARRWENKKEAKIKEAGKMRKNNPRLESQAKLA